MGVHKDPGTLTSTRPPNSSTGAQNRTTAINERSKYSPPSFPFSSVSSPASVSEVAGCNRRSCRRSVASSRAGATVGVPVAVVKTEHPAAVTNTRGSDPGWTAKSAGNDSPPRAPSTGASTGTVNFLWTVNFVARQLPVSHTRPT